VATPRTVFDRPEVLSLLGTGTEMSETENLESQIPSPNSSTVAIERQQVSFIAEGSVTTSRTAPPCKKHGFGRYLGPKKRKVEITGVIANVENEENAAGAASSEE